MNLLRESHDFRNNDNVFVYLRNTPHTIYQGRIYSILKKPFQRGVSNSPLIDYFYISFRPEIYNNILCKGMSIMYKGNERIIDHIEQMYENNEKTIKIYLASELFGEISMDFDKTCIYVKDIDAILIWRVAYCITNSITTNVLSRL